MPMMLYSHADSWSALDACLLSWADEEPAGASAGSLSGSLMVQ